MDILERARDFGQGADALSEAQLAAARQNLLREIATAEKPARSPRRWGLPTLLVGTAAAAAIVITAVLVPMKTPSAAAQVLTDAAKLSVSAVTIDVPAGEFLRIESTSTLLALWDADMPASWARFNNGDPRAAEAGLDVRSVRTLYVPADRNDDWTMVDAAPRLTSEYGTRADDARTDWLAMNATLDQSVTVFPGGASTTPDEGRPSLLDARDSFADMPREPAALLDWWRARSGLSGTDADRWAVSVAAEQLAENLMPADLREASFQALALLDNAEVAESGGGTTTIGFPWSLGERTLETRIVIDTAQGLITRVTELEYVEGGFFPSPIVLRDTTVSTEIVDTVVSR